MSKTNLKDYTAMGLVFYFFFMGGGGGREGGRSGGLHVLYIWKVWAQMTRPELILGQGACFCNFNYGIKIIIEVHLLNTYWGLSADDALDRIHWKSVLCAYHAPPDTLQSLPQM